MKLIYPKKINEKLDEVVIGQDDAKRTLSVALFEHQMRCLVPDIKMDKSNVFLIGPSGTGKTLLIKTLAQIADIPFSDNLATSLTESGYVGEDVENVLRRLLDASNHDIEKAEKGIVFIDEFDKLAIKSKENMSITRDVGGEGVQQALLRMIEGCNVEVPLSAGRRHPNDQYAVVNTNNILFILAGAFEGIECPGEYITPQDLIEYGMIHELVGRVPIITEVAPLSIEDLKRVLIEPKNAIVSQFKSFFKFMNIDLEFTESAITEIATSAFFRETGARGLRSMIEKVLQPYIFNIEEYKGTAITIEAVDVLGIAA